MCFDATPQEVQRQAEAAFRLWQSDPHHRSLAFKQIATRKDIVSVRVGLNWRALGTMTNDTVVWFWIGSHSDYDRMIARL
jgi:hypothetical protein